MPREKGVAGIMRATPFVVRDRTRANPFASCGPIKRQYIDATRNGIKGKTLARPASNRRVDHTKLRRNGAALRRVTWVSRSGRRIVGAFIGRMKRVVDLVQCFKDLENSWADSFAACS